MVNLVDNKRKHYAYNRTYQPIQLKMLLLILKQRFQILRNDSNLDEIRKTEICLSGIEIIEEIELRVD